jgi:hypothetical protein
VHFTEPISKVLEELPPEARRVLTLLLELHEEDSDCTRFAGVLGRKSRFSVAHLLRRNRLPPYRILLGWVHVLSWILEWEDQGTSLSAQAFQAGRYPGTLYRTVRHVTGIRWSEVQRRGSFWVLLELVEVHRRVRVQKRMRISGRRRAGKGLYFPPSGDSLSFTG